MIDSNQIRERFLSLLESRKVSPAQVARECNVTVQAVSNWKRTGRIDKRHFAALSRLLNVPLEYWYGEGWLLDPPRVGEATNSVRVHAYAIRGVEDDQGVDPSKEAMIPVFDVEVAGGPGSVIPEFVETKYRLPFQIAWLNEWNAAPEDILIARVRGSSMEPVLWDGDKVVIHTKRKRIRNDAVYSLIYGGDARVKRLFNLADGSLRIVSDNVDKSRYPDEIVSAEDRNQVYIIGQVIDKMGGGGLGL